MKQLPLEFFKSVAFFLGHPVVSLMFVAYSRRCMLHGIIIQKYMTLCLTFIPHEPKQKLLLESSSMQLTSLEYKGDTKHQFPLKLNLRKKRYCKGESIKQLPINVSRFSLKTHAFLIRPKSIMSHQQNCTFHIALDV